MELERERSLDSLKGRGAHHPLAQRRRRRLNMDSDAFEERLFAQQCATLFTRLELGQELVVVVQKLFGKGGEVEVL